MNRNYLVAITFGVLSGIFLLGAKYIFTFETIPSYYQNGPVLTILIGLFTVLFSSFMFTGISRLFTKNRNKYSKDFKEWSIIVSILIILSQLVKNFLK